MDIEKIKVGQSYAYKTSRGTTGRGKVEKIDTKNATGTWVHLHDKSLGRTLKLRTAFITSR